MQHVEESREMHATFFAGQREGNRLLRRRGHRWKDNIKMGLKVIS
jgi:hypothetical protein